MGPGKGSARRPHRQPDEQRLERQPQPGVDAAGLAVDLYAFDGDIDVGREHGDEVAGERQPGELSPGRRPDQRGAQGDLGEAAGVDQTFTLRYPLRQVLDERVGHEQVRGASEGHGHREAETPVPVLAVTARGDRDKALALGADTCVEAPASRDTILAALRPFAAGVRRVLIIDDDAAARYLLRNLLRDAPVVVDEAESGAEGLDKARAQVPDLIFCDLYMPTMSGLEVLDRLREDPATRGIPVIINTVKALRPDEREELVRRGAAVLLKERFAHGRAAAEVQRLLAETGVSP